MTTPLREATNLLVRRWGEMGGYWGINRTMAEIHALLFVTRRPLCTDDLMDQLKISRGNASMNLRGLVDWGLIERVHKLGDRKEYFQADTDVWHMFETIMRERRRREVEPIITTIDHCCDLVEKAEKGLLDTKIADAKSSDAKRAMDQSASAGDPEDVQEFHRRISALRDFLATMGMLFDLVLTVGGTGIQDLTRMLQSSEPTPPTQPASPPSSAAARKKK